MASPFFFSGSTSGDFKQTNDRRNLLPPCPDSPNCVRISETYQKDSDTLFRAAETVIEHMGVQKLETSDDLLQLNAVFRVLIYKDDFHVLVEEADDSSCHVHIRSASRVGYSDLGVNRRRVKRFLKKLKKELE